MAYLYSSYVCRHSVVVLLIWPACTITMVVSPLSFGFLVDVCPWWICTCIASVLIYASFSANMRADMPCFTGTNFPISYLPSSAGLTYVPLYAVSVLDTFTIHAYLLACIFHMKNVFHVSKFQKHLLKVPMWDWYSNRWSWPIHRLFRMTKYWRGSRFNKPLHNGSIYIPTSLIHCGC